MRVLRDAPTDPDLWLRRFEEFLPGRRYVAIGLPGEPDMAAWDAAARTVSTTLSLEHSVEHVMVREAGPLARETPLADGYTVRALTTDADWEAVLARHRRVEGLPDDPAVLGEDYEFERLSALTAARLVASGDMCRLGAFDATGELVAQAGAAYLGPDDNGVPLARYRSVSTDKEHRRRGLAARLVAEAGEWARNRGAERLIIVAEAGSDAERLYESLGFVTIGADHSIEGGRSDG